MRSQKSQNLTLCLYLVSKSGFFCSAVSSAQAVYKGMQSQLLPTNKDSSCSMHVLQKTWLSLEFRVKDIQFIANALKTWST